VRAPGNSSFAFEAALFAAHRYDLREWYCPQARIAPLNVPPACSVPLALRLSLSSVARSPLPRPQPSARAARTRRLPIPRSPPSFGAGASSSSAAKANVSARSKRPNRPAV